MLKPASITPMTSRHLAVKFLDNEHTMSWKLHGSEGSKGFASLEMNLHAEAGWLSIYATEMPTGSGRHGKQVMMTLAPESVEALRQLLNAAHAAKEG